MSRKWLLAFIILIIGLGTFLVPKLQFETDLSGLRLADNAAVKNYDSLSQNFPQQTENPILILEHQTAWDNYAKYLLMDSVASIINDLPEVKSVSSITNLEIPKNGAFGVNYTRYMPLDKREHYAKWTKSNNQYPDVIEKYVSVNKTYALLYLDCPGGLHESSIATIQSYNESITECEILVLQKNIAEDQIRSELASESILLAVICIGLILLSFFVFTKSLKGLALISVIILFNVSATVIFMYLTNIAFNVQMIALPCLIIIFSFTDLIHILYHQTELASRGSDPKTLKSRLKTYLKKPIFLTSLSNLFGFIIFLILSKNSDLTDLSLVAIVSIIMAYLSSRFIVIHLMSSKEQYIDIKRINGIQTFCHSLVNRFHLKKGHLLSSLIVVLVGLIIVLANNFKIDTSNSGLLANESKLRRSQEILSNHFYGSNTLEISIQYSDKDSLWSINKLNKIEKVEQLIRQQFDPFYVVSPATIVKRNHRFMVNGRQDAYKIPNKISSKTKNALNERYEQWGGNQVISENGDLGKIIIGYKQCGLNESLRNYEQLDSLFQKISDETIVFSLTGPAYLVDMGTFSFTKNLILGWSLGVLLSVLLIGFLLRSFLKGLVLLLVNLIPLLLVVLLMPQFGLEINPQSLFLLTILAGLCVDDSIYIMLQGKKKEIGFYPVLVTSIVLAAGFIAFGFSNLIWLSPFAWIFLIGIVVALILDLFVLPQFIKLNAE
jgi:predicted RND superfamily exporter protein